MIIAISGIPGTGKTVVARLLAKQLNANLIDLKKLKVKCRIDRKRKTKIIDQKDLQKAVNKELRKGDKRINIIESHLSHLLKADFVIILRTNPLILEKRLKNRNWARKKIKENLQAEILDEITIEAMEKHRNVFEIDTTRKSKKNTIAIIQAILKKKPKKYKPGNIDWSEKYKNYLIK